LIGYTNSGKTTLLNQLTGEHLETEDVLFHTLNPTIRSCNIKGAQKASIMDTVGFISHLPHSLVESFKSTLDEVHFADILVHVRDASNPSFNFQK
jgi:GTP-binding protein HflX